MKKLLFSFLFLTFISCKDQPVIPPSAPEATALTGKKLTSLPPSDKLLEDLAQAEAIYQADPNNIDNLIWVGRRMAYAGQYRKAIVFYSAGIARFPNEARLYRHRGHRYITIRQFDQAIADYERAAQLIEGTENQIEPDGMPNAQNIPLTTTHGNIWYHLGLAYYLKQDWEKALAAFTNCRNIGGNDDNIVSSTHWMYMINRRMGNEEAAQACLEPIHDKMTIIENHSYWKLCRFYQGELKEDELINSDDAASANDAVRYGVANWHYYNDNLDKAKQQLKAIVEADTWNSFGHIAAEADWARLGVRREE